MKIDIAIKKSQQCLMEYWPLTAFIATNPLWSLRDERFFSVISHANVQGLMNINYYHERYKQNIISKQDLHQAIQLVEKKSLDDDELNQWIDEASSETTPPAKNTLLAEQIDEYHFQKTTVWIKEQIFSILRDYFGLKLYQKTNLMNYWYQKNTTQHNDLYDPNSMSIVDGISALVKQLNLPEAVLIEYFEAIYFHIYGWSSLMNWRNNRPNNPWLPGNDACKTILLIWLSYEYQIATETEIGYQLQDNPCQDSLQQSLHRRYIWHTAFELHYFNQLESRFNTHLTSSKIQHDAQFIFCIDTRSEGFRRHLEAEGNFQTYGFAGFFGAIFNLDNEGCISYQAPALVETNQTIKIKTKKNPLQALTHHIKNIMGETKKQLTAPFALFELLGLWFLPFMLFKAVQPKLKTVTKKSAATINNTLPRQEQFQAAHNLLLSIGLVDNFSSKVIICSHQSDNINNPFISSLNCGACGGNSGIPNAILMCNILNSPAIREKLQANKISIPESTQFIPACHHTGADRLEILEGDIPSPLQAAINRAAIKLRKEKLTTLRGTGSLSERERNWSELVPELGLINNASLIIGPRALTTGQNLERRAFLHSYEPLLDTNGEILTNILSAPAIVAHWISSQYYFSTVNPIQFGAGNKAIHNVLTGIGVLEGNLSDLKIGLPLQSTHHKSRAIHEPRRITVVVYAKKKILHKAIKNSPDFKKLLDNQWIYLKHIEAIEYGS
ncbi:MAG: DUF2309 domain-containing protein [Gammaproteobacteria bacterium]|nr:DUF2309 domain-containing protein [Gammaproteobacteria bacterium]